MLRLENICWKAPDGRSILDELSDTIPDGKLVAITGPNGSGKTTLARLIAGIEQPTSGRILLDGEDITGFDVTERARRGVSFAFQQPVRFKGLTVRQLIEIAAGNNMKDDRLCDILSSVGLCANEYLNREVNDTLSGGEIKRIEIATVIARHTKLTVFDEPEAGIDLWSFSNLVQVFQRLKQRSGEALLVISHQERILEIADRIVVIADGKVRTAGEREAILPGLLAGEKADRCPQRERSCSE